MIATIYPDIAPQVTQPRRAISAHWAPRQSSNDAETGTAPGFPERAGPARQRRRSGYRMRAHFVERVDQARNRQRERPQRGADTRSRWGAGRIMGRDAVVRASPAALGRG